MIRAVFSVLMLVYAAWASPVRAQQQVWVQIEARPTLAEAESRARDYAAVLDNIAGFRLPSGWYAIAIGPLAADQAPALLNRLLASRSVPRDSFVADGRAFQQQFWPVGGALRRADPALAAQPEEQAARPVIAADETPAQARASERDLTRAERRELQTALQWEGYYTAAIDGAFGRGTRRAMSDWQAANGYDPTGILTTRQRQTVVASYRAVLDGLGMRVTADAEAGIEIALPGALVEFARYEPPFAQYNSRDGDENGPRVLLISQRGDQDTLTSLFDVMQTLRIVPLGGPRERARRSFTLVGEDDKIVSYTYAELGGEAIKGFTLIWPAGDERRRTLVLNAMRASFAPVPGQVLPDDTGNGEAQNIDLLAGLEIRKPDLSRSGFYVDGAGGVLTTIAITEQCGRITLNEETDAEITATDDALGLALLRPMQSLAPMAYAAFEPGVPRLQSEIAVAGYSFEGLLGAPTLTYGQLADLSGLEGEDGVQRLALAVQPGDAGGPVFGGTGSVLGMLLPRDDGTGRRLPADVNFATDAPAIAAFLSDNGVAAAASDTSHAMPPEDLTLLAADMTVLVSCWN